MRDISRDLRQTWETYLSVNSPNNFFLDKPFDTCFSCKFLIQDNKHLSQSKYYFSLYNIIALFSSYIIKYYNQNLRICIFFIFL